MAAENQALEMFANTRHLLQWDQILDDAGTAPEDLTGRIVKWAMTYLDEDGNLVTENPLLDFRSDVSAQLTIPNPDGLTPLHVQMELLPADTASLAPVPTTYGWQLEVFEGDGSSAVMLATGTILLKPNITNA
jgi:hypothetical protein